MVVRLCFRGRVVSVSGEGGGPGCWTIVLSNACWTRLQQKWRDSPGCLRQVDAAVSSPHRSRPGLGEVAIAAAKVVTPLLTPRRSDGQELLASVVKYDLADKVKAEAVRFGAPWRSTSSVADGRAKARLGGDYGSTGQAPMYMYI